MRHTIKLGDLRALVLEPVGSQILVTMTLAGAKLFSSTITPDQAAVMSQALLISAHQAEGKGGVPC